MRVLLTLMLILFLGIGCSDTSNLSNQQETIQINRKNSAPGDQCDSDLEILTESGTYTGTTIGLNNSFIAPRSCSDSYSGDKVYEISLTQTQRVIADLVDLEFDSVLYLKEKCETDNVIVCNDDKNNNDYMSTISALLPAGEYYLIIDGYGNDSTGDYILNLEINPSDGGCNDIKCADGYQCELNQGTPECICSSGNCGETVVVTPGDIIISEFMANPSGTDRYNEWIELYNTTGQSIALEQFKIKKDNIYYPLNTKDLSIKANSYFVIARSPNAILPKIDAIIPDLSLSNSGNHTLGIYINGVMLDQMSYNGSKSGIAQQIDHNQWCEARSDISSVNDDKGTPGSENLVCGDLCNHNCSNHGVCDVVDGSCLCETGYNGSTCSICDENYSLKNGICYPVLSLLLNERDIIITELMPNPAGSDTTGEWIELYNRTNDELSLDGLKINRDDQSWSLGDGFVIAPNSYFMIGRSNDAVVGKIDAVISSMSFNNTDEHSVSLEISDLILDQVSYDGSVEGESKQLDIDRYDDDFSATNWCDKTGTPKDNNETCLTNIDPCLAVDCHHGECISDQNTYLCLCEPGYGGDLCNECDPNNPDCPRPAMIGDLVITELMINPVGSDYHNEFIELYNTAAHKTDLEGLIIQKDTTTYRIDLVNPVINPGGYALIARSNGGLFTKADGYCGFTLNNTGTHTISILINEVTFDQISYNGAKDGIAYQLDRAVFDVEQNDNANFWCDATTTFTEAGENMGTPGTANRGCGPCATIECARHGVCVSQGDQASCVCEDGYHLDENGFCEMDTQCGILYDQVRDLTGDELKIALQQLTGSTYNAIEYNVSRKRMYREIDTDENGEVQCVYTGRKMKISPDEEIDSRYGDCSLSTCVCSNPGMNTEHTWPQGTFNKTEPMKGDVHHLFPTDGCTNGRRSSYPFGIVSTPQGRFGYSGFGEYGQSLLGKDSDGQTVFEPADVHKGDVARAMFYFVTRYSNYSNFLTDKQEAILRVWAEADPVSDKERLRNSKIEQMQWNRNPFIDCPQLIHKITDF